MESQVSKLKRKLAASEKREGRLQFEVESLRAKIRFILDQSDCFSLDQAREQVREMIEARLRIPSFPKARKAGNEVRALTKSGRDFPVRPSGARVPIPRLPPYHLMGLQPDRLT